jgi:ribosomal protein S2
MILRETFGLRIPIIGLINSGCSTEITYPIFGNANSLHVVHFFCHFIAVLIAKEVAQQTYRKESHRIYARTR